MCSTGEFVFSGKTVTLATVGGQVKIGQKGTKEGLVLAPYSPHSASLSDQPSAEVGPTYCTRGEPIQGEGGKKEYLETLEKSLFHGKAREPI